MASYKIRFKSSVDKDVKSLPKTRVAGIFKKIDKLKTGPLPAKVVKLSDAERLYRIRVGDYRIIYEVDKKAKEITIHYIRHRSKVYRKM